jgi:hypothetical protein
VRGVDARDARQGPTVPVVPDRVSDRSGVLRLARGPRASPATP